MRIGLHLQSLRPGEIGGLEVYVRALVEYFPLIDPEIELVLVGTAENLPTFADHPCIEKVELGHEQFANLDREHIALWRLDLWFCPLLVLEPQEPGLTCVVTIPDLQHESHPEFFSPEILAWRYRNYARSLARADRVLTLSEHARRQLIDAFSVEDDRVVAVALDAHPRIEPERTCDPAYLEAIQKRYELPRRFFFYPANMWPHKNHRNLFRALRLLRERWPEVELVLTGSRVGSAEAKDLPGPEEGVRFLGYVPSEHLAGLYASSLGLVFPSLHEGFGLPLVEAMRIGCPVACSASTSLPEIGGDAVLYFDELDPEDMASRLEELCGDEDLRGELMAAGRHRARRFSWLHTARATLEVLRQAIDADYGERPPFPEWPTISVIVPSFEQATFLPRTLDSLLAQGYPELQIIVIDGGSTDGSAEILERYRVLHPKKFEYVSEADRGQAHAVNKGLARARGEVIGWLNSDDTYAPGALVAVAREMISQPGCKVLYGRADYIDTHDDVIGPYPIRSTFDWGLLAHECFLCQPAVFWRRELVEEGFHINENLQTCMDYDLWIRMGKQHHFAFLDRILAQSRLYPENKTMARRTEVFDEIFQVVHQHYGWIPYSWALGRASHRFPGNQEGLDLRPSWQAGLSAIATLLRRNLGRMDLWPTLLREVRLAWGKDHRARVRGRHIRVPASWSGLRLRAKVVPTQEGEISVIDVMTGRLLSRFALGQGRRLDAVVGLPRPGKLRFHQLRLEGAVAGLEEIDVAVYGLLPEDRLVCNAGKLAIPVSWSSAEISIEVGGVTANPWRLVFRNQHREVAAWKLSRSGAFRRWLKLPGDSSELEVAFEVVGQQSEKQEQVSLRWLEMQEGRA